MYNECIQGRRQSKGFDQERKEYILSLVKTETVMSPPNVSIKLNENLRDFLLLLFFFIDHFDDLSFTYASVEDTYSQRAANLISQRKRHNSIHR